PIPLSFAPIGNTNEEIISKLSVGDEIVLADEKKQPIAIQKLDDIFEYDKDKRASHLFGTTDRSHPGVDSIYRRMGDTALGGPIYLLNRADWDHLKRFVWNQKIHGICFMKKKDLNQWQALLQGLIHYTAGMSIFIKMP